MDNEIYICEDCYKNGEDFFKAVWSYFMPNNDICANECMTCKGHNIRKMSLTREEIKTLLSTSTDIEFIVAMDKLKADDIVEYTLKMSQFKPNSQKTSTTSSDQTSSVPKCPTCSSTDIKKISGLKRWFGVGMVGLASSDVGKTMQCNKCGYKW